MGRKVTALTTNGWPFTYDKLKEMRQEPKHNNNRHKHQDHGGGAALLFNDVELMDQRYPMCGRPVWYWARSRIKINLANY